jgi:predicted Zn-dependent protease
MAVLGHALALEGQRAAALDYLQRALAVRPRRPAVWESLAAGFDAAGDAQRAALCRREAAAFSK